MRPKKQSVTERQHVRRPASLLTQSKALVRQNFALQKRRWKTNLAVVLTPVLFCALLHGLSVLIENELGSVNFRCGCKCTSCFDWVLVEDDGLMRYEYRFFEATPQKPCLRSSKCQSYDTTTCGVQYSKDKQAPFCAIEVPPIYPPFIKIPLSATDADSYVHTTPALYTGQNKEVSRKLMNHLIPENQTRAVHLLELFGSGIELDTTLDPMGFLSNSNNCPHNTNLFDQPTADDFTIQQTEEDFDAEQMKMLRQASDATPERGHGMLSRELLELVNNFTHTLSDLGVVMGTPSSSSKSLFLEPALLPPTTSEPLYIVLHNCSSLTDVQLEGLKRASCGTEMMIGRSLHCVTLEPTWRPTADDIDYELYCGWKNSPCVAQKQVNASVKGEQHMQEYISAVFDWKTTRNRHFLVEIRVNDTVTTTTKETPELQRYNEPLNLAANAFLRQQMNDSEYYVRLYGLKGMPKPETRLSIDFSALLGPVFFLWLFQMLLPVNVHNLMYEKQHHLRIMMKMQGLDDRVYYLVAYMWQYLIYCCFILVFIVSGSWLGLSVLTKNQISLQIVFYALWGHVMIAWGFWLSSAFRQHKSAVHTAIVWVIGSGLMGSFLLGPFIIRGPSWIAHAMQTAPSFGLYRGVWELAQYSFLASYNAGAGLTWNKLSDANNGMIRVLITFSVEWILFLLGAWYNDQVLDNGMGTRRHPLFFLGYTYDKKSKEKENVISFTDEKVEIPLESCSPKSEPAFDVALKFTHPPLRQRSVSNQKGSKGSTKSGSSKTAVSRTSAGTSRVVGGTPIDDGVTGTGSYWGSGGSMPSSPVTASPPKLLSNSSRGLAALLEVPVSPVNRHDIHEIARTRTIEAIGQRSAHAFCDDDAPDVAGERLRVEQIWDSNRLGREDLDGDGAIVLRNLRKVYPKRGQAYPKVAVKNLSLAISRQQCFGLLGPNGAGKTTTIRMMEGFLEPSSGSVVIAGYDTKQDMSTIYSFMGACPQHDLLWETLTAREHLLFYGRLKNLKGENLTNAVYASLKSVNLLNDAVGDKQVRTYSGGMKRRLSVAIALIGDPLVAYLDEPSTGLDPSSRRLLWDVIKKAKKKTAIVLTTHSMEEAEALCDRLGIFVGGQLQCIGNPKDLTSRYGSYLQFSITTAIGQDEITAASIYELCPTARPVYALGGTQKFELPTKDVQLQDVFAHMEQLKQQPHMNVLDWGVSNATLEEVFIKITNAAGVKMTAFA